MVYFKRLHIVHFVRDVFHILFDPLKDLHDLLFLENV